MEKSDDRTELKLLKGLKNIQFDFEHMTFEVNGISINDCTDIDIAFHNNEWTVSLGKTAKFTPQGYFRQN